ncbi:39S ribosomal protein L21, mitochondrial [Bulinus truncatus]|nr:39S ribosomal protein L21, mitochondrial [Bulinus truncatus]
MAGKTLSPGLVKNILQTLSSYSPRNCYGLKNVSNIAGKKYGVQLEGGGLQSFPGNCHVLSQPTLPIYTSYRCKGLHLSDSKTSWALGVSGIEELEDFVPLTDPELQQGVAEQINKSVELGEAGRLFAVVYVRGMQHKITTGDIIAIKLDFPPNVGDRLRLEKVLAIGGKDFTLFGQPLLGRDVVRVDATVVEKTLSHNRIWFVYRKRKNFKRFHLFRETYTMLVINSIQVGKLPLASQSVIEDEKSN